MLSLNVVHLRKIPHPLFPCTLSSSMPFSPIGHLKTEPEKKDRKKPTLEGSQGEGRLQFIQSASTRLGSPCYVLLSQPGSQQGRRQAWSALAELALGKRRASCWPKLAEFPIRRGSGCRGRGMPVKGNLHLKDDHILVRLEGVGRREERERFSLVKINTQTFLKQKQTALLVGL